MIRGCGTEKPIDLDNDKNTIKLHDSAQNADDVGALHAFYTHKPTLRIHNH
jgi:hypothetical protein